MSPSTYANDEFHWLSYSFVKYLIDTYGIDDFMLIYNASSFNFYDSYKNIFGQSFEELKAAWRQTVEDYATPITLEDFNAYKSDLFTAHNYQPEQTK